MLSPNIVRLSALGALLALLPAPLLAQGLDPMAWAGLYAGIQLGFGTGDNDTRELPGAPAPELAYTDSGVLAGLVGGYNWQTGSTVYGVEGDLDLSHISGRFDFAGTNYLTKDILWAGSIRGRYGMVMGDTLFYGTAGLAFARVEIGTFEPATGDQSIESQTTHGWTAGLGIEHALDDRWHLRAEYRYTDFGETSVTNDVYGGPYTYPHSNRIHALRVGVVMRF